ncbi:MAG TPA: BCD family MFS transporter [Pseudomonadales bacterium]|nr:BCD family MFS transporter [Pseudomonadales bacterium]
MSTTTAAAAHSGTASTGPRHLGWVGIIRLGLVQTALGAIVVLTTSTINRVMVVELALPAMLPGALVALHYMVQILRPRLGHGSDVGGRRTPWILGGMLVLAIGGVGAAAATALIPQSLPLGILLAVAAFLLVGVGVGAAGTSLLVLLAKRVEARRRPAAATIVWMMMIVGFIITAATAGQLLDPFSLPRLVAVSGGVAVIACLLTVVALWGVEGHDAPVADAAGDARPPMPFRAALAEVWSETEARRFTLFVFVSMLAYSAQDLILEPFAGTVFGMTPGQSTALAGTQNGGVLLGMILVAVAGSRVGTLRGWTSGGCIASALALVLIAVGGFVDDWPLKASVFALGMANGTFAVAAIGSMMGLVARGHESREGVRMGLWGAAQAIAFGLGGFIGTAAIDLTRALLADPAWAYATVFLLEAATFVVASWLAIWSAGTHHDRTRTTIDAFGSAPHATPAVAGTTA